MAVATGARYRGSMAKETAKARDTAPSLLGPDEPPGAEIVNGGGKAGLVLICDHASNRVPRALDRLGLADGVFAQHVAYDIGAAAVARRLSAAFDAPLVLSGYSRLVIDCNRPLDDPTSIPEVSDNIVIPGNEDLSSDDAGIRAAACFHPYHDAIRAQLTAMDAERGEDTAIVSIHSFTPLFGGFERPWHIGVLWNADGRLALPFMDALARDPDIRVGDNEPYSARENFGFSMAEHGEKAGRPHLLVEIRQDLIMAERDAKRWSERIGAAIESAIATLEL